jgi:FtsH-binding integral membrane protein
MPTTSVLVERLARTPRTVFVMDGVGALVTALLVGVVLPTLGDHIGMPRPVLRALALTAAVFAAYSLTCAATRPTRWPDYLRAIALANAGYGVVTAALLVRFHATLHVLDWLYFVGEIIVMGALVTFELRVARAGTTDPSPPTARAPLGREGHGGATR